MKFLRTKDLLIKKEDIEFAKMDNGSIIVKIKNEPYVLFLDYDCTKELNVDFELLINPDHMANLSPESAGRSMNIIESNSYAGATVN